jgi:UDP-N-acetylglucosamine pyrophosphorylase
MAIATMSMMNATTNTTTVTALYEVKSYWKHEKIKIKQFKNSKFYYLSSTRKQNDAKAADGTNTNRYQYYQ